LLKALSIEHGEHAAENLPHVGVVYKLETFDDRYLRPYLTGMLFRTRNSITLDLPESSQRTSVQMDTRSASLTLERDVSTGSRPSDQ